MELLGIGDSPETSNSQSQGLDDLYKTELNEAGETYELPFPIQTVERYASNVDEHFEADESNSVLDLDKGQVEIIKMEQEYSCDSQILQQYLNDSAILRTDDQIRLVIPERQRHAPKMDDFEFNSSDSFSSTESIIPKNIPCPKCPKRFMFKSDLTRHDKHKHAVKQKLTCNVCKKEFFSQQNLRFHEKSHRPTIEIICLACNKSFRTQTLYNKHMAYKHKKTKSECEVCGKMCVGLQAMDVHAKTHAPEAHICQICGKMFRKLGAYKSHTVKHETETATEPTAATATATATPDLLFKCNLCTVTFRQKINYDAHMKTHQPPHKCNQCTLAFTNQIELKKHIRAYHRNKKVSCQYCGKELTSSALKQHIKAVHKTLMQESCTQTGEDLSSGFDLQNVNMVLHPTLTTIDGSQSIILTPVANFGEVAAINSLPIIIGRSPSVPFSSAS